LLHSHKLPDPDRERLERELAGLLGSAQTSALLNDRRADSGTGSEAAPKLGESYAVWELPAAGLGRFSGRLNLIAQPTGRVHHQVSDTGGATATHVAQSAVRSEEGGNHRLRVQSVLRSHLASQLDDALTFAHRESEAHGRGYQAHLLIVPSRLIHALWLEGSDDDKVVVIDMPQRTHGLERHRIYHASEFMNALAGTEPVGVGLSAVRPSTNPLARVFSRQPPESSGNPRTRRTIDDIRRFFIIFLFGNVVWICIVAIGTGSFSAFLRTLGVCGLLSGAALIVGVLFGFIFGIPRSLASTSAAVAQQVVVGGEPDPSRLNVLANTNLEQISDWLTKVLVGVGLTQLTQVGPRIAATHDALERWSGIDHGGVIGLAILAAFGCGGFVWAYFESRTSLMQVFSDDDPRGSADQISVAPTNPPSAPSSGPSAPGAPTQTIGMPPALPPSSTGLHDTSSA
jgi:hypothetical protein